MSVILIFALTSSRSAYAHATVIRSEPVDGALLATAPPEAQLWFDEPLVDRFITVRLVDAQNQIIGGAAPSINPAETDVLHVTLPPLAEGSYTLFWKVLSDVDGHFSQGFLLFSVGQTAATATNSTVAVTEPGQIIEGALRWLNFVLIAGVVGALALAQFVLTPLAPQAAAVEAASASDRQRRLRRQLLQLAAGCASGALVVGVGLLAWQLVLVQDAAPAGANWLAQGRLVLTQTLWGAIWLVREGVLLILAGGLWFLATYAHEANAPWARLAIFGRAIDLVIIQAISGHALGSTSNWFLAISNATLHLLAASVWIGGLLALAVIVLPAVRRGRRSNPTWQPIRWRRFSLLAATSVALLVASGLLNISLQVASPDALLTSTYGRLLLVKIGLVVVVGLCGLGNAWMLHPRLAAFLSRRSGWLNLRLPVTLHKAPRLIAIEVILGILIFGVTGLLTATAPPRGVEYTITPDDVKATLGERVDDLIVTLTAKPNRLGDNLFTIRAVSTAQPAPPILRVLLNFTYIGSGREAQEPLPTAIAEAVDSDLYQVSGNYFSRAGVWQIEVVLRRNGVADSTAHFRWVAPPMGKLPPVVLSKYPWATLMTAIAGIVLLVSLVLIGVGSRLLAGAAIT